MVKSSKSQKSTSSFLVPIHELTACIAKDQINLEKAYVKASAHIKKDLDRTTKELQKARDKNKKLKKSTTGKGKKPTAELIDTTYLVTTLDKMKEESRFLKSGYENFKAQQKALAKLEKTWQKTIKTSGKPKKPVKHTETKKNKDPLKFSKTRVKKNNGKISLQKSDTSTNTERNN